MFQDKLGCYRVGDLKFYSKLEAIEAHQRTGIHPHWDFNEAVFSCYDWTREPTESITELYRRRAQQIRDRYEYVILMFSGGADSETVLRSFLDNDIKLDEVVTWTNYQGSGRKDDHLNSEFFRVALPRFEQLRDQYPWLRQRVIDLTDLVMTLFSDETDRFDWIHATNMFPQPNVLCRRDLVMSQKDWADMIHQGKKVCVITGADKPRVLHENGRYSVRFLDIVDLTVKSMAGEQPYTDELFYWTPDMPEIVIKQGHMIKNYLERYYLTSPFVSQKPSQLAYKKVGGTKYWLDNHGVHTICYPNWNIETYSSGKTPSPIFGARDRWFFELGNMRQLDIWQMNIEARWNMVDDYWKNDPSDISKGFKGSWSRDYYLEKEKS